MFPLVPSRPTNEEGRALVGVYAGALDEVRWGYPSGWLWGQVRRALTRKRWFQASFVSGDLGVVVRIADQGLFGVAEVWVADLSTGHTFAELSLPGVPLANVKVGPVAGNGTDALAFLPQHRVRRRRADGDSAWELLVNAPALTIEARLDARGAPTPVTIIGESAPGDGVLSQRLVGLGVSGRVRVRSETRELATTTGTLEYVNGFFPHALSWSSAALLGERAAYLSDLGCLGGPSENVAWADALPRGLAEARFALPEPARPGRGPWSIASADDRVRLGFTPRAVRVITRGFGPVASSHAWVFGRFSGSCDGAVVSEAAGLCEARDLKW